MLFDERPTGEELIDQEEIWSAIRYLDPDTRVDDSVSDPIAVLPVLVLVATVGAVWVVFWLRVRGL